MRIKVTNSLGAFISSDIVNTPAEEVLKTIRNVVKNEASFLELPTETGKVFFPEELLKLSVIEILI